MRIPLRSRRPARRAPRRGFSMVEVLVAIVLLGVALSSLGVLAFQASRRNRVIGAAAYRAGAMSELVDRYSALEFDDLSAGTQSLDTTITTGPMPHRRRAVFEPVGANQLQIRLIVTPTNTLVRPETTVVKRYKWVESNPLNMAVSQ